MIRPEAGCRLDRRQRASREMCLGAQAKGRSASPVHRSLARGHYTSSGSGGTQAKQGQRANQSAHHPGRPVRFEPRPGEELVLNAEDPVLVVLGGAGTGKTTVAAAAVRKILDHAWASGANPRRALFLSFSRAAVGQIVDQTSGTLGPQADFVEITTFHAFAWHLIRRWGGAIGLSIPTLISPSEAKLFGASSGITYDDLLPLALKLLDIPAIRRHLERRSTPICRAP